MRVNRVAELLANNQTVVNGWISSNSPYGAEVLSHAGYDSVTIDLQHGMFGIESVVTMLQAVGSGPATPMVRCTKLDHAEIGKLLDAGAYGIICPSIDTAEQCEALVSACRYPPLGNRSYGPARGLLYGGQDYVSQADVTVQVWAMVESKTGLDNVRDIATVPGLNGIYVGPNDLAMSLGIAPAQVPTPSQIGDALSHVKQVAHKSGIAVGTFCGDIAMAKSMTIDGFDMVTPGNDMGLLKEAVAHRIAELRGTAFKPTTGGY